MEAMINPDNFDAPCINFSDLPEGMGKKLEVGDTIVAKEGDEETVAEVIGINEAGECAYLSKALPLGAEYVVKESSVGDDAKYDAMRKQAALSDSPKSEDMSTMPLPDLKRLIISISIEQGDCNG